MICSPKRFNWEKLDFSRISSTSLEVTIYFDLDAHNIRAYA
jgi:hypothetical protein